jgi:hypothetical protein
MTDNPFKPGAQVAIQMQGGWRAPHSFKLGRVAKVHKNGNFTLEGSPQQWRPYAPSSYENFWRAGGAGSSAGVLWIVDEDTKPRIVEQNAKAKRYKRYTDARYIIEREPFSDLVTEEVLEKMESVVAILKPPQADAA